MRPPLRGKGAGLAEDSWNWPKSGLNLDEAQREHLGIEPGEEIRVLSVGVRTVLLERSGGPAGTELPWDRDLVLTSDVRAFPLADTLDLLHSAAKSGYLFFTHQQHAKSVWMHRGEVVFAASNQNVDRLGECLLRAGVISVAQQREAERFHTARDRFGKVLVERGFVTPRELWNGVKCQVEEIVRSLFAYTAGTVYFWEGEIQPDNVVRLSLPTRRLVAEGVQRRDELFKFLTILEDPRTRLIPIRGPAEKNLGSSERALYEALKQEGSFATVCRRAGLDPLSAARTVQMLRMVGTVELARTLGKQDASSEQDLRKQGEDAVRNCVESHTKLLAELVAPIVAVEGFDGPRLRLERVLRETELRYPELLSGLEIGPSVTLDPERLIERALRLPSERERHVSDALGELVAYMEFELKNHPQIDQPDQFLEGLQELRSSL